MINKVSKFLILCLLIAIRFAPAHSQTSDPSPLYSSTDLKQLAKAYLSFGRLDVEKDNIVDQYLMISECGLYKEFFSNDIEWNKIRTATRDYLKTYASSFPKRFEFTQPIYLDRYDFKSGSFRLAANSIQSSVTRMIISGNSIGAYPCLSIGNFVESDFPVNAVVTLSRPFNYSSVQTDQLTAEEYLKYLETNKADLTQGRPAYIRYRLKISQYSGAVTVSNNYYGNFFGELESISVFGDKDLLIKLEDRKF